MKGTYNNIIAMALEEDLPQGDITTEALQCDKKTGTAFLVAKGPLVLSGCEIFEDVFKQVDPQVSVQWVSKNGDTLLSGTKVAQITGPLSSLLKAERVALNFLGHFCGVATLTAQYVEKTKGTHSKITDTRKTTPGLRQLEKNAVKDGGGVNHRMSLSDAILIKENHIRTAGSITKAAALCKKRYPEKPIEVEVTNLEEINEALEIQADRIMLDNMNLEEMKTAKKIIGNRAVIEASGNMTLDRINAVAKCGVDYISVGALTHSAPVADLSILHE